MSITKKFAEFACVFAIATIPSTLIVRHEGEKAARSVWQEMLEEKNQPHAEALSFCLATNSMKELGYKPYIPLIGKYYLTEKVVKTAGARALVECGLNI